MTNAEFVKSYAHRLSVTNGVAQHLINELCEELLRQLVLGEDVCLAQLGKFSMSVSKPKTYRSNLPALKGKLIKRGHTRKLRFQPYGSVAARLSHPFTALVSGNGTSLSDWSVRKESIVAKKKSGEHVTVDLPEGVKQITINVASEEKPKRKKRESGDNKRRLLG